MNAKKRTMDLVRQDLVLHDLQLKALIQDILVCRTNMDDLNDLNNQGRRKISELRQDLADLDWYAIGSLDDKLMADVQSQKLQFSNNLQAFKNANISSLFSIEKLMKEDLLSGGSSGSDIRQRRKTDKHNLVEKSSAITDQLLSISRKLAETTQRSAETLDTLARSSSGIHNTHDELQSTAGTISQSGKLLMKYDRREFTDYILIFFAFMFFVAVVLYILNERVFKL